VRIYVDCTHVWRRVTGLERVTLQQFSREALAPLDVVPVNASRVSEMVLKQNLGLPVHLARTPSSLLLCPGFPPTPLLHLFKRRVIPFVHDVFLLTRRFDLNWRAKAYLSWSFALAVRGFPRFLVNSMDTAARLAGYCRKDAEIVVYRPHVANHFELSAMERERRPHAGDSARLVALGTVEPRKNFVAAARIVEALRQKGFPGATLEVIGRHGWGDDWRRLSAMPGVVLHGYRPDREAAAILNGADALICTSYDEGLGLPLLEAQYAGLPVVAPDQPVFREVLDGSGLFIDPQRPCAAADAIAGLMSNPDWRVRSAALAGQNLRRWNTAAAADRRRVIAWLSTLAGRDDRASERLRTAV
jgi:glycosyltransferase involved in cell wall biosynthesis